MTQQTSVASAAWAKCLLVCLLFVIATSGCNNEKSTPATPPPVNPTPASTPPDYREEILTLAEEIVSDPNNWSKTANKLTQLIKLTSKYKMQDWDEVLEFRKVSEELMKISTSWLDQMNSSQMEKLGSETKKLQMQAAGSVNISSQPGANIQGQINKSGEEIFRENQTQVTKVIGDRLTLNQAETFVAAFSKALSAYQKLYLKVKSQN